MARSNEANTKADYQIKAALGSTSGVIRALADALTYDDAEGYLELADRQASTLCELIKEARAAASR